MADVLDDLLPVAAGPDCGSVTYLEVASWLPTTAAILGFLLSPTGWVTSAPMENYRLVEDLWSEWRHQD